MENLVIIGSGPAGLTAGIYAARAGLQPLVLEGLESGGQLMQTQHVANYPGFAATTSGPAIIAAIRAQAEAAGVRFKMDVVEKVDFTGEPKKLFTMMGDTLEARAVIVATGAGVTKTGLPGEAKFFGRGISACLTCDGAFYTGKTVVVVGDGAAAKGAANYLARLGATVAAVLAPAALAAFEGDEKLRAVRTSDGATVAADGVFLVTARTPQTQFLGAALPTDARGHVVVADQVKTGVSGVFAAGDCARANYKQAVVAAGDGALAALEAAAYLGGRPA